MINVIIDLFLSSPGGVGKLFACVFVVLFCFFGRDRLEMQEYARI